MSCIWNFTLSSNHVTKKKHTTSTQTVETSKLLKILLTLYSHQFKEMAAKTSRVG